MGIRQNEAMRNVLQDIYAEGGLTMELKPCPFCGQPARIFRIQNGYAICCNDKSCLGMMEIRFGSCDNEIIFKEKLISNWNKRQPEVVAVQAAFECIREYRNGIYDDMQEPYDDHGNCCMQVLDEALNRLQCFTTIAAIEAWNRRVNDG